MAFVLFVLLLVFNKWQTATSYDYLEKGDRHYEDKDYTRALERYKYALEIDGSNDIIYQAKLRRAKIFLQNRLFDKARKELAEAIEKNKNGYEAYEIIGDIDYLQENYNQAAVNYQKAGEPRKTKEIDLKLAKALIGEGNANEAAQTLNKLYSENKNDADVLFYLGLLEFNRDIKENIYFKNLKEMNNANYNGKLELIQDFLNFYDANKNPDYNSILIADLYNRLQEAPLALWKLKNVLEKNPAYRDGWILYGKSNFLIEDYSEALAGFNKALELDSAKAEIYFWMGNTYAKLNNEPKSKEYFDKYELLMK